MISETAQIFHHHLYLHALDDESTSLLLNGVGGGGVGEESVGALDLGRVLEVDVATVTPPVIDHPVTSLSYKLLFQSRKYLQLQML